MYFFSSFTDGNQDEKNICGRIIGTNDPRRCQKLLRAVWTGKLKEKVVYFFFIFYFFFVCVRLSKRNVCYNQPEIIKSWIFQLSFSLCEHKKMIDGPHIVVSCITIKILRGNEGWYIVTDAEEIFRCGVFRTLINFFLCYARACC